MDQKNHKESDWRNEKCLDLEALEDIMEALEDIAEGREDITEAPADSGDTAADLAARTDRRWVEAAPQWAAVCGIDRPDAEDAAAAFCR